MVVRLPGLVGKETGATVSGSGSPSGPIRGAASPLCSLGARRRPVGRYWLVGRACYFASTPSVKDPNGEGRFRGVSSAGRALPLQGRGRGFESRTLHVNQRPAIL